MAPKTPKRNASKAKHPARKSSAPAAAPTPAGTAPNTPATTATTPQPSHGPAKAKGPRIEWIAGVIVFIVALSAAIWLLSPAFPAVSCPYRVVQDNLVFCSEEPIAQAMAAVRDANTVLIAADVSENDTSAATNAFVLLTSVLVAEGKDTVNLAREYDTAGSVSSCMTNDGNALFERTLDPAECAGFEAGFGAVVEIRAPDEDAADAVVRLRPGRVTLAPNAQNQVQGMAFDFLDALYPETARAHIDQMNQYLASRQGGA